MKLEKHPDPPLFDGDWKTLRPFVMKLRLKLFENVDRFLIEINKVNYAMSCISGDAALMMDLFY